MCAATKAFASQGGCTSVWGRGQRKGGRGVCTALLALSAAAGIPCRMVACFTAEGEQGQNSLAIPSPNRYKVKGITHAFQVILLQLQPVGTALAGLIGTV